MRKVPYWQHEGIEMSVEVCVFGEGESAGCGVGGLLVHTFFRDNELSKTCHSLSGIKLSAPIWNHFVFQ